MQGIEKLYFTSDQHYGHHTAVHDPKEKWGKNKRAQFKTVADMNNAMIESWNLEVPEDGEVYMLGDFVFYGTDESLTTATIKTAEETLAQLNGTKHLIVGNHDLPFKNESMAQTYLDCGFETVTRGKATIELGDKAFELCHFPRWKAHTDINRPSYYPEPITDWHSQNWLIHGHTHGRVQVDPNKKAIDVGVDAWSYRPVSARILLEIALGVEDLYSEHGYSQPVSSNAHTITG